MLLKAWIRLVLAITAGVVVVLAGIHVGLDVGGGNHSPTTTITRPERVDGSTAAPVTVTTTTAGQHIVTVTDTVVRTKTHVVIAPPANRGIHIAYGAFRGKVKIIGAQWHPYDRTFGAARLDMQAEYTAKRGCRVVKSFGVAGTLFDRHGAIAETSSTSVFDLVRGIRAPATIRFFTRGAPGRIELLVTALHC